MSTIKYWMLAFVAILGLSVGLLPAPTVEPVQSVQPIPMPLYKGKYAGLTSVNTPMPNRDDSVKKYLIPSVRIRVPGAGGHSKGGGGLHPGNRPGHQQLHRLTQNAQGAGGNHERTHGQGGQEHAGGDAAHDWG
jgi:hypothetical protein